MTSTARSRLLLAGLAVGLVLPGVAAPVPTARAQPAPTATPSPPRSPTAPAGATEEAVAIPRRLPAELGAVLARFPTLTTTGSVGIAVQAADGTPVWASNASEGLLPASTMKSLTAGSVLAAMGPDGAIATTALGPGPVRPDGTLAGSLVVRGQGDPTLTSDDYRRWVYPSRPSTAVEDLADALVDAGLSRIAGDVVGDGTAFGPSTTAAGWPDRYLADFDAHPLSGLTIDTGRDVDVDAPPGGSASVSIVQSRDPVLRTAAVLARALADRGVVIEGRVRRATVPTTTLFPLASVQSPPMRDVLAFMLQESDNHLADTLVRAAAVRTSGIGTWRAAGDDLRRHLQDLDVATTGFVLSDGSGLSRTNRVSADLLVANDRAQFDRWGQDWSRMLAVAGESGTLAGRLVGTPAQGRVFAKTGTLDDVRGLTGHVTGPDGGRYHFAMLVNDVDPDVRWQGSVLGDELALVLTDALDGCRRRRVVEDTVPATEGGSGDAGTEVVRRRVTATPARPGPPLSDGSWTRACA